MWELLVVTVGKMGDEAFRRATERYAAMVGGEWRVRVETVPASRKKASHACRREEGEALRGKVPRGVVALAMDPSGEQLSSEEFASYLSGLKDSGRRVAFLIGGPHGLDGETLGACQRRLSLSRMTLPHELATVVLMEQIYRAHAHYSGKPYAK